MQTLDYTQINRTALLHVDSFLEILLPGGKRNGHEYVSLNPTRADSSLGSFKINMTTGAWSDFATGDAGGDLISLYAYVKGVSQAEAAIALLEQYGSIQFVKTKKQKNRIPQLSTPLLPVPDDAPPHPRIHYKHGEYTMSWAYRNGHGKLLGYVCRFDLPDKRKEVLPLTFCQNNNGAKQWRWKSFPIPRPLYGLDQLNENPERPVLIVEGEKCAESARKVLSEFTVVSWIGGSKAVSKIDFSPLHGRGIILWPDNDEPGFTAMWNIAGILRNDAASIKVIEPPPDKPAGWDVADAIEEGWSQQQIMSLIESGKRVNEQDKKDSVECFWYAQPKKNTESGAVLKILQSKLRGLLETHGFGKLYVNGTQQSMFVRIIDNIVEETSPEKMKDFVLAYIKSLPATLPETGHNVFSSEDLLEVVERGANTYFGRDKLECLEVIESKFFREDKHSACFFYQNGFVAVTRDGDEFQKYCELDGLVWKNRLIKRNYTESKLVQGDFETFLKNVCSSDDKRLLALRTAIGYLLHQHKNRSLAKTIILVDEKISDIPEGRTGKSLISEAIGKMRSVSIIDGKSFKFDGQFAFQSVSLDTDVVVFDDVDKKFPFENMFHMITGGLEIKQKNKPRIKLDFEDSPKFLITTNYIVQGEGGSAEARKVEYELSPHYSKNYSPRDEFGHNLFDDWSVEEWANFDQFMLYCTQSYLTHGLLQGETINLDRRRLIQETTPEFVEWSDGYFRENGDYKKSVMGKFIDKKLLFSEFCGEYEYFQKRADKLRFTPHTFTKWLKLFATCSNLTCEDKVSRIEGKPARCIVFHH